MAFLVVLESLSPIERAVYLLREVFDYEYDEIAAMVEKSEPACRKLLERARQHVAVEKHLFAASPDVHRRLLAAFVTAARAGDVEGILPYDYLIFALGRRLAARNFKSLGNTSQH